MGRRDASCLEAMQCSCVATSRDGPQGRFHSCVDEGKTSTGTGVLALRITTCCTMNRLRSPLLS